MTTYKHTALSGLFLSLALGTGCGEQQPRNACSFMVTNGYYGVVGYNARYTVQSASGAACKAFLGVDQAGEVTGETLGVTAYGRFGDKIGLRPLSAAFALEGEGVAVGEFNSDPNSCVAASMSAAEYLIDDPTWVAPDPLPDPAPTAPQIKVAYTFSNVRFIQAANIPGTQMTGAVAIKLAPAEEGNGAAGCEATLAIDGLWYASGYARCETDEECTPEVLDVPGGEGSYKCIDYMPMMPDYVPVIGSDGQPVIDPETEEPVQQAIVPRRCAPTSSLPIGAVPYEE